MKNKLSLLSDYSLQGLNTFGIAARARTFLTITEREQLQALYQDKELACMPRLILGGGSNLLLPDQVDALVLHMQLKGRRIVGENEQYVFVQGQAGESWHDFVQWTLQQGIGGLENLSLIPGTVGAAPIQNVGAYGVEIQDVFHQLSAFDFETGEIVTLNKSDCCFAYRDSVFKHAYRDRLVILDVTFALPRQWQARCAYADVADYLTKHQIAAPQPADISAAIIAIRQAKLPDPAVIGNAGSFFKNPIVDAGKRESLLQQYPQLVSYLQADGQYKLAAGWLIDQCGWKGKHLGRAGVYEKQALVLVNLGGASGNDVRELASAIQRDVGLRFGVQLEAEPVFIAASR
ncbi:UDP-N-acetylmuramate dehydrogenase [Undibacterium sp. SXout7W]|uniref:UDP-N-acetylmuramate dehydrogenase n=1 Tax=Undibacterium sp. SXout7W TaxID=3413049 RepID=UPI003BF3C1AE